MSLRDCRFGAADVALVRPGEDGTFAEVGVKK